MADKYCYSKGPAGDYGFRMVHSGYEAQTGEVLFDDQPTEEQLNDAFSDYSDIQKAQKIRKQIVLLEARMTPRRMREAVLGTDGGWLTNLEKQIASLRAEL